MPPENHSEQFHRHFRQIKEIIQAEEMWERVPAYAREFSPENLEGLVKFAYFGGFIDLAAVRRFMLVERSEVRRLLQKWYDEVRELGCWLC